MSQYPPFHGAFPSDTGTTFRVWAPKAQALTLVLEDDGASSPMGPTGNGYFETTLASAGPGTRYRYQLDGGDRLPDPASRFQPEGVHGPSEVVDAGAYAWRDGDWTGCNRSELVFYELHVGTFSPEGTFEGVRERLPYLRDLGVTAVELMPVHDFPGRWNWGYDSAALYAPSRAYGSPDALRRLVDEAHRYGLAVFLDVIYNHFGPDGAYAAAFAPFFTDKYETPWGSAINLDDDGATGVRRFFIDNALHWLREYHVDGLRLDATHALRDDRTPHFLAELSRAVATQVEGPPRYLIAEDHRNLDTLLVPREDGGYGLDGVWSDDLHHQLRHLTAGDAEGYYRDYVGTTTEEIATTLRDGWYFRGQQSVHLGAPRGTDPARIDRDQCVVFIQNHDQVGNRPTGDRLTDSVSPAVYRGLSALLCFVPELPLLFMGQEWAASTPFQYFTDHHDELGRLVTEGRTEEFEDFAGFGGNVPDPQDPDTFRRSRLDWDEPTAPPHDGTLALYRDLLELRPLLGPAFEIEAPTATTLVCRRRPYRLLVNLKGEATLSGPADAECALHTEQAAYARDGNPPARTGPTVHFARPGAMILRETTRETS